MLNIIPMLYVKNSKTHPSRVLQNEKKQSISLVPSESHLPLFDANYNRLMVNHKNISFSGGISQLLPPLEKRISSALQGITQEDVVVIAKNLSTAKKCLRESIDKIHKVIKKLYYIEDPGVEGAFAITENSHRLYEVMNLDKNPIVVNTKESGKALFLSKGEYAYVTSTDDLKLSKGMTFRIARMPFPSKEEVLASRLRLFNFAPFDKKAITSLNTKHLEMITDKTTKLEAPVKITFADVGGQEKAIEQLKRRIVFPIEYPSAFPMQGAPRGVILTGGPGTGKTLMAKAVANEVDANFTQVNGSELDSKWVGDSEENWRKLFSEAKDNQPSVIFIDEIDAVAKTREGSTTSRYDDKVVNQILTLMSDLEKSNDRVFVIAATNKVELLDAAIKRSGRFGDFIAVENPNLEGCRKILGIYAGKSSVKVSPTFNQDEFAQKLFDSSVNGADIAKIVTDAKEAAFAREQIFEKMEKGTFKDKDVKQLKLEPEDFEQALKKFKAQLLVSKGEGGKSGAPMGFKAMAR